MHCPSLEGKHVLILDDNQYSLGILHHLLSRAGAQVVALSEPSLLEETLLRALKENIPFDLCIVDIQIPQINVYTIARKLRKEFASLPLVALSSSPFEGSKKWREVGFNSFFPKPVHRQKFLEKIEEVGPNPYKGW